MLLRTSSAPVLSSLHSPCFSQPDAGKDPSEFAQFFSSAAPSFSHSLAPLLLQPHCSSGDLHGISPAADDPRAATARDLDPDRFSRTRGLSRVQSDGDLAHFSPAMSAVADENEMGSGFDSAGSHGRRQWARRVSSHSRISSFDMKESILEESEREEDTDEQPASCGNSSISPRKQTALPGRREALPDPKPTQGFVLNDGELYTSFEMSPSGSPVACNAKGCRPLKDSECKKLGFLDMASGLGSGFVKWGGVNGWIGQDGGGGPEFSNNTEAYYESLLQADPENPLLLRNYAQFLSEKKGDFKRSEEYYERAILACPNDGEVLSQYAKLQWDVHKDQDRAETYYDQAVQAAPDDCYVMASYASFLWDAEENEEENPSPAALPVYGAASHVPSPLLASA